MGRCVALNYGPVQTNELYSPNPVERRLAQWRIYNHSPKGRARYRRWRQREIAKWGGYTDQRFQGAWLEKDVSRVVDLGKI